MSWVSIPKPTGSSWTHVRNGFPLYDDTIISYDDSANFFDGDNPSIWTDVPKPIGITWNELTMTWNNALFTWDTNANYTYIAKPNG